MSPNEAERLLTMAGSRWRHALPWLSTRPDDHPDCTIEPFRTLALLGRLLLPRVDSVLMQASEKPQHIITEPVDVGFCTRRRITARRSAKNSCHRPHLPFRTWIAEEAWPLDLGQRTLRGNVASLPNTKPSRNIDSSRAVGLRM